MLTISVKNFGPIAEGSVDLKPLTIFVGPSNTGKSYMATGVYAVTGTNAGYFDGRSDGFPRYRAIHPGRRLKNSRQVPNSFVEWVWQSARQDLPRSIPTVADLPEDVRLWLQGLVAGLVESFCSDVSGMLHQIHGGAHGFLKRGNEPDSFHLAIESDEPPLKLVVHCPGVSKPSPEFSIGQVDITDHVLNSKSVLALSGNDEEAEFTIASIADLMADSIAASLFVGLPSRTYYFPAARSGIVQGQKVLASEIVRQSSRRASQEIDVPILPGVATEFLANLISMHRDMQPTHPSVALDGAVSFIETKVLEGKIYLDESAGLPFPDFAYETDTGKFTLDQTSSMVSELAPLILFLKYLVRPGDLLILEEPESHLHPAAQLQLARGIARLVNAGVKVLITTHSGDFMGQIDNLLRMSNSSEKTARSLGLEEEDCLSPEQVSAYGFRLDSDLGGAVAYPLPVGSDVGIEDEEFLPVAELLYHQALDLEDARLT